MAIIQNNVKFNQTMTVADSSKQLEDFGSKERRHDESQVQPYDQLLNNPGRRQRLSEARKDVDLSTMTQNTMSFGSFYQKANEP